MQGVVFLGDQKLELRDFPKPEPGVGEVLIQMKASGLCGSDLHYYRTPQAQIPSAALNTIKGHEPCGVVVALGPRARNVKVGDRVIIHHYVSCGKCEYCLSGWLQLCQNGLHVMGSDLNGSNAEYMLSPDIACVPMPDELSFEEGAILSCGTGTAWQGLIRLDISGRDTLAIFGQGPVGVGAAMLAKAMGARVIAVDTMGERLELSKQVGADEVVNAAEVDPAAAILKLTDNKGADATMDTSGSDQGRINSLRSARMWGRACFIGERGNTTFDVSNLFLRKQITIHGSWTFSTVGLMELADFVVKHKVPLKSMISHRFSLSQAEEAFKLFAAGKTNKALFVWP
jgi:threonine dehydrogenase-like Zn-dependent dehydrogenase